MAVPRVYVRRGTTVWIGTYLLTDGRTNIDFFIPLHNRPQRGNYKYRLPQADRLKVIRNVIRVT